MLYSELFHFRSWQLPRWTSLVATMSYRSYKISANCSKFWWNVILEAATNSCQHLPRHSIDTLQSYSKQNTAFLLRNCRKKWVDEDYRSIDCTQYNVPLFQCNILQCTRSYYRLYFWQKTKSWRRYVEIGWDRTLHRIDYSHVYLSWISD